MEAFVVRVFTPVAAAVEGLHGTVVHLASGQEATFADADALISFLTRHHPPDSQKGQQSCSNN